MTKPPDTSARSPDLAFAQAWSLWLAYRSSGARPLRASTRADYDSIYQCHLSPTFAETPMSALDGLAIARFSISMSATALSPKRISNVLVPLRACLRWHHRIGTLAADPGPWFETSAPAADERRILTPAQIESLAAQLPLRHAMLVRMAAYTGLRAGEIRALTWGDIDFGQRSIRVDKTYYRIQLQRSTKTGRDRTVPLPPHIAEKLERWRVASGGCGLVFPGPRGGPLDLDTFRARVFKPAAARAGLPPGLRFHDLRHTSASLYLQSGATVREVMEIHGWTQMQTALRYLHTGDTLGAAAERLSRFTESPRAP